MWPAADYNVTVPVVSIGPNPKWTPVFCVAVVAVLLLLVVKGKPIPLQAWTGPEGFGSLRLLDFKTIGT